MKYVYIILCSAIFYSCDKMPENGELDGMWQMLEEQHLSSTPDGGIVVDSVTNKKSEGVFWGFQLKLMSIRTPFNMYYHNGFSQLSLCRFVHEGKTLDITQMYIHLDSRDFGTTQTVTRDSLVTDPATTAFSTVGIKGNKTRFIIERLDRHAMILRSDYNRLVFRKY